MEAKKAIITCKSCGEELTIDFNQASFSSQISILNGKKQESRTYLEVCPNCETVNTVTSENKAEWGNIKGPNVKMFMFSGLLSCFVILFIAVILIFFAFKGLGTVMDWVF
ncbi:redox protein [Solibacillus sp. FSL H8-0538]|uniref:redox protein n=1 Tax=Solibacillus sp. FSL H8-0538 TaxID=2921400 RepID=UPI0030FD10C6